MSTSDPSPTTQDIPWTEEALTRLERAPSFLKGMVRRLADKKAKELGYAEITVAILEQFKNQMMGQMGGEVGMSQAAEDMAAGKLPWTAEAKKRLGIYPGVHAEHDRQYCRRCG